MIKFHCNLKIYKQLIQLKQYTLKYLLTLMLRVNNELQCSNKVIGLHNTNIWTLEFIDGIMYSSQTYTLTTAITPDLN